MSGKDPLKKDLGDKGELSFRRTENLYLISCLDSVDYDVFEMRRVIKRELRIAEDKAKALRKSLKELEQY